MRRKWAPSEGVKTGNLWGRETTHRVNKEDLGHPGRVCLSAGGSFGAEVRGKSGGAGGAEERGDTAAARSDMPNP